MSIIVFTCDNYLSLIPAFASLFNKHWGVEQEVKVLGFKEPDFTLPSNFKFLSAGKQKDFPPAVFCAPFRPLIESLADEVITYFLDDTFVIGPVRHQIYHEATDLIREGRASKIELFWGGPEQYRASKPFSSRFRCWPQDLNYRCNLSPSIINKDYFLKYFNDNMTMHDYEIGNMSRSKNDGANVLISWKEPICPWFNVIRQGRFNSTNWNKMKNSSNRQFAWNRFQTINSDDEETIEQFKNWRAA